MAAIHNLLDLGSNSSGDKAGFILPKDDLRLEGLIDDDGQLIEQPQFAISYLGDGEWRIERLDGEVSQRAGD